MAWRIMLFNLVQVAACFYALRRGGAPERWVAFMMAAAAALTAFLPFNPDVTFFSLDEPQLLVDASLLLGLTGLALRADRFWPMWVAALQLIAITVHVVRGLDPTILPIVYNRSIGKLAYPMILLLVVGTYRHRQRAAAGPGEQDWSPLRWR